MLPLFAMCVLCNACTLYMKNSLTNLNRTGDTVQSETIEKDMRREREGNKGRKNLSDKHCG